MFIMGNDIYSNDAAYQYTHGFQLMGCQSRAGFCAVAEHPPPLFSPVFATSTLMHLWLWPDLNLNSGDLGISSSPHYPALNLPHDILISFQNYKTKSHMYICENIISKYR